MCFFRYASGQTAIIIIIIINGQRILTKSRIAVLSPWRRQMDSSNFDPLIIYASLNPQKSVPKRHLDRFSHFSRAQERVQQTDTQTNRPTTLLRYMSSLRCGIIIIIIIMRLYTHGARAVPFQQTSSRPTLRWSLRHSR